MVRLGRMRQLIRQIPPMAFDLNRAEATATKITATLTGMPRGTDNHSKVEDGAIMTSDTGKTDYYKPEGVTGCLTVLKC